VRVARPSPPLVPAQAGTQSRRREPLVFDPWIPAPRSAEAKPLRLRGGECAGMSGKCCSPARRSPSSIVKQPLANAPPPVLFEAPGRPPSVPPFRGGRFLPLDNSRGMERLEAHQSCVIRAAFWTARAPLGAPLAAFFLAMPGRRFASRRFALPSARSATPCGRPRHPCLGQTSAVRRQPAPGGGSLVPPGRARHRPRAGLRGRRAGAASTGASAPRLREGGRRISGTGLSRRLRHQDRL